MAKSTQREQEEAARREARKAAVASFKVGLADEELFARMNKASWEKMYYFIEGTKLIPEYGRLLEEQERLKKEYQEKHQAQGEEVLSSLAQESDSPEEGGLELGTAEVTEP